MERRDRELQYITQKKNGALIMKGKKLTGIPGVIRDVIADIHNYINQWNRINTNAISIIKIISEEKNRDSLQDCFDELDDCCSQMDHVVKNINKVHVQLKSIPAINSQRKFFGSWETTKFGDIVKTLYKHYDNEARVKRIVLDNIGTTNIESHKTMHLATWVHQPLIPDRIPILIEAAIQECDLA